jgi:hypothetical protein
MGIVTIADIKKHDVRSLMKGTYIGEKSVRTLDTILRSAGINKSFLEEQKTDRLEDLKIFFSQSPPEVQKAFKEWLQSQT